MKEYLLKDNEFIILGENEQKNINITKEKKECDFCIYKNTKCLGDRSGQYCDYMTFIDGYNEVSEE